MDIDPVFIPIRQLSELIHAGKASPVELTEVFLGRLEELGPRYNAVVTVTEERALKQARKAEEEIASGHYRGPLHGVPYGAKDLLATSGGIPTTWGATPFRRQVFDYDATVIRRLEEAGAVLCAKLAMIELAGGMGYRQPNASFTGPCRNPWNIDTWSGGSSSGSGSSVCAGLVPFAIGSETWGSILSPANNCGVAGLRPTYGLVSRHGAMALSWTLDKLGPLCQTVDDCGLVLEAIAGSDLNDPTTSAAGFKYDSDYTRGKFKIAFFRGILEGVEDEVAQNFHEALKALHGVAIVNEIEIPDLPYEAVTRTILYAESASAFEDFIEQGGVSGLTAPEDHHPHARFAVSARDYLRAMRLRKQIAMTIDEAMSGFDAVVAPTSRRAATPIDMEFRPTGPGTSKDIIGAIGNSCGLPSISVPSGFTKKGLPTGIQFMGRAYGENSILALGRAYQKLTSWHKLHPPDLVSV